MNKYFHIIKNLIIAIIIEVIVFNITSYCVLFGNNEKKTFSEPTKVEEVDDVVRFYFENVNLKTKTIKVEFEQHISNLEYRIYYSDETGKNYRALDVKEYIREDARTHYIPLVLSGKTNGFVLEINKAAYDTDYNVSITVNESIPIDINITRIIAVLIFMEVVYISKHYDLLDEKYDKRSFKHEIVLLCVLALAILALTYINVHCGVFDESTTYNEDYVKSILSGRTYLSHTPSKEFLELDNPYDAIDRGKLKRDKDYLWDTAYYNGHEYLYFGVLPALILFLPYYVITGRILSIYTGIFIFSLLILILLKEILLMIVNRYYKDVTLRDVAYALAMILFGSLVIYANGMGRVYELVIIAGLYFVIQGIYFILRSVDSHHTYRYIFLGSLFLALSVACRPVDLLISIMIVPYLLKLLKKNISIFEKNKKPLFKLIIGVAVPYLSVGAALMWFNYIRFGNPFEFGARYQLTINDMGALGYKVSSLPVGILVNFFAIPHFTMDFPFILHQNITPVYYGYYYIENMIGGLFMLAPICWFIFVFVKKSKTMENKELKSTLYSMIVTGIITSCLSILMAGSNQRYLIDYAWIFIFAGIMTYFWIVDKMQNIDLKNVIRKTYCVITIFTCIVGFLSGVISEKSYFKIKSPKEYNRLKYTICFWE